MSQSDPLCSCKDHRSSHYKGTSDQVPNVTVYYACLTHACGCTRFSEIVIPKVKSLLTTGDGS